MGILFVGWIVALGLCVGSFLTVVTARVPVGGSVLFPPSTCPGCEHPIRWHDNIPVVSWLILRGRCRHCGIGIPLSYPALELGVGLVFGIIGLLARPRDVPVALTIAVGVIATGSAFAMHRRFSARIAMLSLGSAAAVGALTIGIRSLERT